MNSRDFLVKMCPLWHSQIASIAEKENLTMSQVIRNALQAHLNLPEPTMQVAYRNTTLTKSTKVRRAKRDVTRVTISCDLPRWMDAVLKYAAQQKGWSVSTLVCVILHHKFKDTTNPLPSKPPVTLWNEGMVKRIPLEDAPEKYNLRASIPVDWEEVLIQHAADNEVRLSVLVRDILIAHLGGLREIAQQS